MDIMQAIKTRHAVRSYTDKKIEGETLAALQKEIAECAAASGLSIQLCINEPNAFNSMMARYGKVNNVKNYIALVGNKNEMTEEKCGYYGQKIVLTAQQLGLNTCWMAMSFSKSKLKNAITIKPGEKLIMVIALGYGESQGVPHQSKPLESISNLTPESPTWFRNGVIAAQLAPTAMNQQKFMLKVNGHKVQALPGSGFYTKVDLGIVKYNFEVGAGNSGWEWAAN